MKESMRGEVDAIQLNHTKRIDAVLTLKENTAISRKIVKDSAGKYVRAILFKVLLEKCFCAVLFRFILFFTFAFHV